MNQESQSTTLSSPSIEQMLTSHRHPVTVFSLSWCSYCHAVKQLLQQHGVPFEEYVLDRGELASGDNHPRLRQELLTLTQSRTLPQVFVARHPVGGYTETLAAFRSGQFEAWLKTNGASNP